ncbi:type III-A CRISPR-associated protein Csm2 [Parabacteroides sp.]
MYDNNFNRGGNPRSRIGGQNADNRGFQDRGNERETAEKVFGQLKYEKEWITSEASASLVEYAREMGEFMAKNGLTNSKIRSIYGEIKRIQMGTFENEKSSFFLLKPKVAYALGRDDKNEGLRLFQKIFDKASADVSDQRSYQNFCGFIEAILAYHKFYGGKD